MLNVLSINSMKHVFFELNLNQHNKMKENHKQQMEQTNQTKYNISHVISVCQAILINVAAQVFVNQPTITPQQFMKILLDSSNNMSDYTYFVNRSLKMGIPLHSVLEIADNIDIVIDISKKSPVSVEVEELRKQKEIYLTEQLNILIDYYKNNPKENGKS